MADPNQITKSFSIMGSSFIGGAGMLIDRLKPNCVITLTREPDNPRDVNAVAIYWGARKIGWVPAGLAAELAPHMDRGVKVICRKAPPLPKFGAYRGILELAYIPAEPESAAEPVASEAADTASAEGQVGERIPQGENFPDDFDE